MTFLNKTFLFAMLLCGSSAVVAQDDLLSLVDDKGEEGPKKVYATFKTTRIGNAQTIETVKKNHLDFRISHRFGNLYNSDDKNPINNVGQNFLGFDQASDIRFSFDYGVTDNLQLGIGRSRMHHILDGSIKWKILTQTSDFSMPISLAFFSSTGYTHDPPAVIYAGVVKDFQTNELHRFNFFNQLVIASKLNDLISLELLPSYMHRNFIKESVNPNNDALDQNSFFSLGFGARIKMTKRLSFIGDYFYNFSEYYTNSSQVYNPLALGFEIETGGHVFSLFVTNASGLIENNFIPYTTDTWNKGQVKLGFAISRTFAM